jgi:hypothetical protein
MISLRTSAQKRDIIISNRWDLDFKFVWIVCTAEYVSLEKFDDGVCNICFGPLETGRLPLRIGEE